MICLGFFYKTLINTQMLCVRFPGDLSNCETENRIAENINVLGRTYGTVSPEPLSAMPLGLLLSSTSTTQTDNMQKRRSIIGVSGGKKEVFLYSCG